MTRRPDSPSRAAGADVPVESDAHDNLAERLAQFAQTMEVEGHGMAPNGASYRIVPFHDSQYAVERTHCGELTTIVGFSGNTFLSRTHALAWAIADGRHEYVVGVPLSSRRCLI
jgi:hypothetical protein